MENSIFGAYLKSLPIFDKHIDFLIIGLNTHIKRPLWMVHRYFSKMTRGAKANKINWGKNENKGMK